MFGVDLIVSSLALHHLNDAKKQYLYKAAAERMSPRGALLVADLIEPQHPSTRNAAADRWDAPGAAGRPKRWARRQLFQRFLDERWNHFRFPDAADQPSALMHHLVWLRHAGFAAVDCCVDGCRARRLRRLQAGCSVSTATSGGQLIRTGT